MTTQNKLFHPNIEIDRPNNQSSQVYQVDNKSAASGQETQEAAMAAIWFLKVRRYIIDEDRKFLLTGTAENKYSSIF